MSAYEQCCRCSPRRDFQCFTTIVRPASVQVFSTALGDVEPPLAYSAAGLRRLMVHDNDRMVEKAVGLEVGIKDADVGDVEE